MTKELSIRVINSIVGCAYSITRKDNTMKGQMLLDKMIDNFEWEMDADGYGIEKVEKYHFIIEDFELMGWDYVHGAKRFIEYFFGIRNKRGKCIYPFSVNAEFEEVGTREVHLITGEVVQAPLLDIKYVVREES